MAIDFSTDRWEKIKRDYASWWAGELKRPLINVELTGVDAGRPEPDVPFYGFTAFYGFDVDAERIVDRWDYDLSRKRFPGDAFPCIWANFGPGVLAAFLGAEIETSIEGGTVWFRPVEEREPAALDFEYDAHNKWFRRIRDIYGAAVDRWEGRVQLAMTDLGGNLDVLSTFRPGEKLLLDLYDHPEEIKRLTWQVHELWFRFFDEFNAVLRPANPGYTAWTPIFSEEPYYMLQCDFCYMIGPDMFDEFVKPELAATCKRLVNPFYHLDGPGQLPHLDSLLAIDELKGVQWVPGAGAPDVSHWPEVYRKIRDAGKLIQVFTSQYEDGDELEILDILADQLGSAEDIALIGSVDVSREKNLEKLLSRYGAI